ncbi:MAG TPA: hypothetical protein VIZ18_19970 [Ktedonobacteraceae bacterium]
MHSKKVTLPLLPFRTVNEPSLLPSLPPDEPDEETHPRFENFSQNAQIDAISEEELESWDGEIDPLNAEEEELESWDGEIDPFEHRHIPTSVEAAPIEEADIRHAFEQVDTHIIDNTPVPPASPMRPPRGPVIRWQALPRRHRFFVLVGLLVVLLLIGDGALFLLNMTRPHASPALSSAPTSPTLTVTPAVTHPGEIVTLHLSNFSPASRVLLTRDMQLPVRTARASSLITPGSDGHADVPVLVEDNWEAGAHLLLAEDIHSHYTASVSLQVVSDFPTPLPHLVVGTSDEPNGLNSPLSFGSDLPQVNTLQSLLLRNSGGSWISWQAASDQPWLTLAPRQGVFQESQGVFVAAARVHLAPGYHQGTLTITSNASKPIIIQVDVNVLPQPKVTSALLVVEPPLLSFTATDGAGVPPPQYLTVDNPGVRPLNWSLTTSVPQDSLPQNLDGQNDYAWLHTDITSGVVPPGASARVQVMAQSQQLLPGVYGGILLFSMNGNPLAALQPVAIALTVQPRCGVVSNPGSVGLTVVNARQTQFIQPLAISPTPGCADATNWQDFPQATWLKMTPARGQLQPGAIVKANLLFNANALALGTYTAQVDLLTEMRSQTLMVQLTVLSPSATLPATTPGSTPTIAGTFPNGTPVPTTSAPGTPVTTPSPVPSSTVIPGTPTPTTVPGTPTPTPVPQPCVLQVAPARLVFVATLLQSNPPAQTLTLSVTGSCSQPLSWTASVDAASQGWLHLATPSGVVSKSGSTLVVQVNTSGKLLGTYSGQITLTAIEQSGAAAQGSPWNVPVILTVVL